MEWEKPTPLQTEDLHGCGGGGGGGGDGDGTFVKVMTDEQMGILQKQIAAYAAISEQLVELHKSLTSQNDLAGMRLGNMYGGDPLVPPGAHKITGRQRWTPTPTQLQILEHTFNQEGSIGKPKIPEITGKLLQYGQISETNVYNWFQNRRARSKRKQQAAAPLENAETEVATDAESPNEKTKTQNFQSPHILTEELNSQDHLASDKPEHVMPPQGGSLGQLPFYAID